MLGRIERYIRKTKMLLTGDRVIAAVSGGHDSVALLHILSELKESLGIDLEAAHLNHCLRGAESDEDEAFAVEFSGKLHIPIVAEKTNVTDLAGKRKISIESAARLARYDFLERAAKERGAGKIALGHTMDDQVETVLLNFLRGAGLRGLAGMLPIQGKLARPLLEERRDALTGYLRENGIPWRTDSSNLDERFTRNRIRHKLIPFLEKEFNPGLKETLARNSGVLADLDNYISAEAERLFPEIRKETPGGISFDLDRLGQFHSALATYCISRGLFELMGDLRDISSRHLCSLAHLLFDLPTGSSVTLPAGLMAQKTSDSLEIFFSEKTARGECPDVELSIPGETRIPWAGLSLAARVTGNSPSVLDDRANKDIALFDFDSLEPPFLARSRRTGDRFQPFGMTGGSKKVKDVMIEKKIPRFHRERIPVLCDRRGVLWIVGVARSNLSKVEPGSRKVLIVEAGKERETS